LILDCAVLHPGYLLLTEPGASAKVRVREHGHPKKQR